MSVTGTELRLSGRWQQGTGEAPGLLPVAPRGPHAAQRRPQAGVELASAGREQWALLEPSSGLSRAPEKEESYRLSLRDAHPPSANERSRADGATFSAAII